MVAKINTPTSIVRALNYNEQKVQKGAADCIYAGNFLRDADELNFYQKLERFENLISLNEKAKTNSLHISLNFDPADRLDKDKLVEIASIYMEKIGFGQQPYLVYHHTDAGHPHIHIVTTSIQSDGKRINTFNIGRNQSEKARKEIELTFKLVIASGKNKVPYPEIKPADVQKAIYGKSETKRAITNVLDAVINTYKYTSIAELNAVLKRYNVIADRGKEDSAIFKKNGIVYRILDANGNKAGVPIKASSIYSKPTLSNLQAKFEANEIKRKPDQKRVKTAIDWVLVRPPQSLPDFIKALQQEKIATVVRQSDQGMVYGLTYIDHQTKAVFNGSDIGSQYSAKAVLQRMGVPQSVTPHNKVNVVQTADLKAVERQLAAPDSNADKALNPLEILFNPSGQNNQMPNELNQAQKQKKPSHHHH
jgi:hypothetical protein